MTRPFEVRDDLRDILPYKAPQADAPIRLNTNESPWPPPEGFFKDLSDRVKHLDLHRYPDRDARTLRAGLAERHGWDPAGVWAANGSNEILQTLLLTFGGPGRKLALFEPTYAMHAHLAKVTATEVVAREVDEPWVLDPQTVAWGVSFDPPSMTFICSPNNPTGTAHPNAVVEAALESGPGLVVVDEAYGEFARESAIALLPRYERLVVIRSFSKSWRLAGARIGYLLAHPWLVEALQVARLPYHLSQLTQACGEVALRHQAPIFKGVEEIVVERERLSKELERVPGLDVFPSQANFILFRTPAEGTRVWRALADAGVLIRDFSTVVPRALRVTVGTADQNAEFVETLRSVLRDAE
ncbi:MAG TPA: histidinol-phosphate transaminase [Actinomycetota bacterium]|nr:histidinol-phosphate transaminase [Actinomycetota bacterium]